MRSWVRHALGHRFSGPCTWRCSRAKWDALDAATQQRWRNALPFGDAHLAVRSLGLRAEVLARAPLNNDLVRAVRRHAHTEEALRAALLPVALRGCDLAAAHALIAAMPPPSDPGAFFCIASGSGDSDVLTSARSALRTHDDLACAVALQRSVHDWRAISDRCATLRHALHGRPWDDLTPLTSLLDDAARTVLMPDADALIARLARPDRREALRRALAPLASLPPAVALPTYLALDWRAKWHDEGSADALADALHAHGGVFLALADALAGDLHQEMLPLPSDAALADALRALARDDPPTARRLAHACHNGDWRAAIRMTLALPAHHRAGVTPAAETLVSRLARPDRREALRRALARLASLPPEVDIPARFALDRWGTGSADAPEAAAALAEALHAHGDVFLELADAITSDDQRPALLPLPDDPELARMLRGLAHDDPLFAFRMAYAYCDCSWRDALLALLAAAPRHADAVWQTFDDDVRQEIGAVVAAAPQDADPLAKRDPLAALALAAVHAHDADLRAAGVAALAQRPGVLRQRWTTLPPKARQSLCDHPAVADLSPSAAPPAGRRGGLIRRRS